MNRKWLYAFLFPILLWTRPASADIFGSGENTFQIDFVTIADPGNAADTTGAPSPVGAVDYVYRIGKYEIPEHAIRRANAMSSASGTPLAITLDERGPNKPATGVSWFEAAQFVNWLNEDKNAGPAYKFDVDGNFQLWAPGDSGYNPDNPFRSSAARYFLPSVDEWYKAAFYEPEADLWFDYPNGMNMAPSPVPSGDSVNTAVWNQASGPADVVSAGGQSPFGTVGQAGNVFEWEETSFDLVNSSPLAVRGIRGGAWGLSLSSLDLSSMERSSALPTRELTNGGFRIAAVPEPDTMCLVVAVIFSFKIHLRRCRDVIVLPEYA